MNQTIKDMIARKSCRRYKPDMLPKEIVNQIIEAGLYAASGKNKQDTLIIAVSNKELRDKFADINRIIGGWEEGHDPFYGAPVILVVLAKKDNPNGTYDGSLVMGNLMLAASALGIGNCWINRAKQTFEMEEYQKLVRSLGIEGEYEGIGHCALGYADGELHEDLPRRENRVFYID